MRLTQAWAVALTLVAAPVFGQTPEPLPSINTVSVVGDAIQINPYDPPHLRDLQKWIKDYSIWRDWQSLWRNRRYETAMNFHAKRLLRPEPPEWLPDACLGLDQLALMEAVEYKENLGFFKLADEDIPEQAVDQFQVACVYLNQSKDDIPTAVIRDAIGRARAQADYKPRYSKAWNYLHVDALYFPTSTDSPYRGLIGIHFSIPLGSRLQIFAAPGFIYLCSSYEGCLPGYDFGFGVRLFNFRMPLLNRPASLHLNMVKAWTFDVPVGESARTGRDIAGISFTFR